MRTRSSTAAKSMILAVMLAVTLSVPGAAQTGKLTDDQIHTIEYHYKLDQYMVGGCILGATFGAVTGVMTLSGLSIVAAVPYISTGCSLGFLLGPASMFIKDYLLSQHEKPRSLSWHWSELLKD
ncbi:MAG: hypothetical protein WCF85_03240 [Rhodospirillaceae bacterium]